LPADLEKSKRPIVLSYWALIVISTSFLLGFLYAIFLSYPDQFLSPLTVIKHVSGNDSRASYVNGIGYLPVDSALYLADGLAFSFSDLSAANIFGLVAGQYGNVSLYLIAKVASQVLPENPYVIITLINHVFLLLALRNYLDIIRILRIQTKKVLPWIAVNLLLFFALYTLNKEAIGIFLISEFVLFEYRPSYLRVFMPLLVALFTRNLYFAFGILVVVNHIAKLHPLTVLAIFSAIILPGMFYLTGGHLAGEAFGDLDQTALYFEQKSAAVTTYFFGYIEYPLGYVLSYCAVLAVNILGPILNYGYWADYLDVFNLSQFLLQLSSLLFVFLILKTVKGRLFASSMWNGPFKFFVYYTMFSCVLPLSQHRYLLPIYPIIVLSYVYCRAWIPQRKGRVSWSYEGITSKATDKSTDLTLECAPPPRRDAWGIGSFQLGDAGGYLRRLMRMTAKERRAKGRGTCA